MRFVMVGYNRLGQAVYSDEKGEPTLNINQAATFDAQTLLAESERVCELCLIGIRPEVYFPFQTLN